ncbi:hypothetical protein M406DRAFT_72249 [Cryphonectria parasitica EP155]|uniref:Uncharacterized protein n=1 Tax=Cryphonectria parasitica (strain ATCC 38755 / EP155) TaxID=660469 RepID=A0A9P5CLW1_CRYP1|nr:uncharacterized protein M406DRAFT_72249 [Cryphonectria parasitica EP155]KAF3762230.1 hypothetical protein M406DRAFT_72249 [Cryphonectria parasitica EP155]
MSSPQDQPRDGAHGIRPLASSLQSSTPAGLGQRNTEPPGSDIWQEEADGILPSSSSSSSAAAAAGVGQGARSDQFPALTDANQQQEAARAAFSANSEVMATTPRRSAWTRSVHPLSGPAEEEDSPSLATNSPDGSPTPEGAAGPSSLETAQAQEPEQPEDPEWRPSLAIGSIDASNLSPKEAARRHMLQWQHIHEYHRLHSPHALPTVERSLAEARRAYEELCMRDRQEDMVPRGQLASYQRECIEARTALLRTTLAEVEAGARVGGGREPMRVNIMAALSGYGTGEIGFSERYTLIYAGRIVDTTCRSYAEFTADRQERLDMYLAHYGPGYLWWEPPLARGAGQVLAKRGTILKLDRGESSFRSVEDSSVKYRDDACHYKIPMGFRRDDRLRCRLRKAQVEAPVGTGVKRKREHMDENHVVVEESDRRDNQTSTSPSTKADDNQSNSNSNSNSNTEEQDAGHHAEGDHPIIVFDTLLDSGAELPVLLHDDFKLLGFNEDEMIAATVVDICSVAAKTSTGYCFELLGGLDLHASSPSSFTTTTKPPAPWSAAAHFHPTRVLKLPSDIKPPPYGAFTSERLSGMLPFLAYYLASAPGTGQMALGQERHDVLGSRNMPGAMRYDPVDHPLTMEQKLRRKQRRTISKFGGAVLGLRRVTFESEMEEGRMLIDEDIVSRDGRDIKTNLILAEEDGSVIGEFPSRKEYRD